MLTQIQPCRTQTVGTYCTLRALQILHLNSSDVIFMQWQSGVVTLWKWKHHRCCYIRVVQSQSMSKFVHCCVQQILTWNKHPIIVHLIWNSINNNNLPIGQAMTRVSILVPCPHEPQQGAPLLLCTLHLVGSPLKWQTNYSQLSWNTAFPLCTYCNHNTETNFVHCYWDHTITSNIFEYVYINL